MIVESAPLAAARITRPFSAARPGQWAQFAYCPVRYERMIQAPQQYLFVIGVSGVVAEKTGAAREQYNRASRRASVVAEMWRQATGRADPHLAAAIRSAPNAVEPSARIVERPTTRRISDA